MPEPVWIQMRVAIWRHNATVGEIIYAGMVLSALSRGV